MIEDKPRSLKELLGQAKTSEDIWFDYKEYGLENDSKLTKDAQKLKQFMLKAEWVPGVGLQQALEQLRQKALDIDKPSNDYAEVCKQNRQYRSLLRDVLGEKGERQEMRKQSREEKKLQYQATHKLLCPQCEGKTPKQMMLENMWGIPFLVKSKCSICGYDGMFVEVSSRKEKQKP